MSYYRYKINNSNVNFFIVGFHQEITETIDIVIWLFKNQWSVWTMSCYKYKINNSNVNFFIVGFHQEITETIDIVILLFKNQWSVWTIDKKQLFIINTTIVNKLKCKCKFFW